MGHGIKLVLLLIWLTFIYITGILLFTQGFLLKRLEIPNKSSCHENISGVTIDKNEPSDGCWTRRRFKKAVVIIIDALRYDFALYNESLLDNETLPYQNKLKIIHEVLTSQPSHGRLYKFIADPPTTTMQRLKGMTTGSLPTFIDMGSNFASTHISEDNFLFQLVEQNKNITFMGDDTWIDLFPGMFKTAFAFPSFNVKDLHTVDNGVMEHLVPELIKTEWDLFIAHFLGVDHCGHKFGPYHNEMSLKLTQMDSMLRSVIETVDDDSVLFVLGDHGMTRSGDHGGDSQDEVSAALFVYSKQPVFISQQHVLSQTLSQIDIVPTISLLMGTPIPFANLGSVILDLFQRSSPSSNDYQGILVAPVEQLINEIEALHVNVHQVRNYMEHYTALSGDIPQHKLADLLTASSNADSAYNHICEQIHHKYSGMSLEERADFSDDITLKLTQIKRSYTNYLSGVRQICRQVWAKFDFTLICLGLCVIVIGLIISVNLVTSLMKELHSIPIEMTTAMISIRPLLVGTFCGIITSLGYALYTSEIQLSHIGLFIATGSVSFYVFSLKGKCFQVDLLGSSFMDVLAVILWVIYCMSMFSNSFVVYEDNVSFYFSQTLLFCIIMIIWFNSKEKFGRKNVKTHLNAARKNRKDVTVKLNILSVLTNRTFAIIMVMLAVGICARTSALFYPCREEQTDCETSSFLKPLSTLIGQKDSSYNYRYWSSAMTVIGFPALLWSIMHYLGNLNGHALPVLCIKYALPTASVSICLHWAMQIIPQLKAPELTKLITIQQIVLPDVAYALCLITITMLLWKPLFVYIVIPEEKDRFSSVLSNYSDLNYLDKHSIPKLYKEIRLNWGKSKGGENDKEKGEAAPPTVYGLATVYSTALKVLIVSMVIMLCMILGDGLSPAVFVCCAQMCLTLELYSSITARKDKQEEEIQGPPVFMIVLWCFFSSQYFFSTGHQATIPSIRFDAAFVGLPGDMQNHIIPGFLILMNTYASHVLFAASLPLMLFWSWIPARLLGYSNSLVKDTKGSNVVDKGQFIFWENPWALRSHLFKLLATYQAFCALKVLAVACSAALHSRHLMVWKIFAPHFIFEAVGFLISSIVLVVVFLVVLRVDVCLQKLMSNLENYYKSKGLRPS